MKLNLSGLLVLAIAMLATAMPVAESEGDIVRLEKRCLQAPGKSIIPALILNLIAGLLCPSIKQASQGNTRTWIANVPFVPRINTNLLSSVLR